MGNALLINELFMREKKQAAIDPSSLTFRPVKLRESARRERVKVSHLFFSLGVFSQ